MRQLLFVTFIIQLFLGSCNTPKEQKIQSQAFKVVSDSVINLTEGERYLEAFQFLDSSLVNTPPQTLYDQVVYYNLRVRQHYFLTQLESVEKYLDSVILHVENHPEVFAEELINSYFAKGDLSISKNDMVAAIQYYFFGRNSAMEYLTPCKQSVYLSRIGDVLYKQQNYELSIVYALRAFDQGKSCPYSDNLSFIYRKTSLITVGLCYEKLGNYDKAIEYYNKGLHFIDTISPALSAVRNDASLAKGVFLGNLGNAYAFAGEYNLALESIFKSKELLQNKLQYKVTMVFNEIKLANLYLL